MSCNEFSAPFDLGDKLAKRTADSDRRLAELPDDAFGVVLKAGLGRHRMGAGRLLPLGPKRGFSPNLRPPYHGPFPNVPVLMLNGDIDLQSPPESAERAKTNWPNSVFLTIRVAPHVTVASSECALRIAVSFLQNPLLPDGRPVPASPHRLSFHSSSWSGRDCQ